MIPISDLDIPEQVREPEFERTISQIKFARREIVRLEGLIQPQAADYLNSSVSQPELYERAAEIYWNIPEVKVGVIAAALFGDPGLTSQVSKVIPPKQASFECEDCGKKSEFDIKSRSAAKTRWLCESKGTVCPACKARREITVAENSLARAIEADRRSGELEAMPYREYLQTPEWREIRMSKLRSAGFRCQLCNGGGQLNVHHRNYDAQRGEEDMRDLIVLCQPCHAKFHGKE